MEPVKIGGAVLLLMVLWSLYRAHKGNSDFNLLDLVMQKGRADKLAVVFIGSWAIHSWIMITLTDQGKMNEGFITLYAATWIAPIMAKIFAKAPESTQAPT
jgi:hypothetical protein